MLVLKAGCSEEEREVNGQEMRFYGVAWDLKVYES